MGESGPARSWARRHPQLIRPWRSPPGQPRWARPALLVIAGVASLAYGYGMDNAALEPFYGAAARSMSESWHNFFFGAVDPWGTVSVDKLPGALWVQSLSVRIFGFHVWAVVLPQVVEGVLTVLVLYRAVRRVAGAGAGLAAAAVLAVSPVTVLLNRGNISDSLLMLLLVLAADAATRAIVDGGVRPLLLAGLWVGLAFQTKMLQAWLVLPALYLAYLIAAPAVGFLRRSGHILLSALVVVVVSLSWMSTVSAIPAHDRPYVDGSCDDSVFSQVFLYNGISRIGESALDSSGCSKPSPFLVIATRRGAELGLGLFSIGSGWDRLLRGDFARDDAWVLVPSLVAAVSLLIRRRRQRRPRTDPIRAATVLWLAWLVITGVFFSEGRYLNSYYVAALIPPMAALCGMGAAEAWRLRHSARARAVVIGTVAISTGYSLYLLPGFVGLRGPILASTLTVAALAVGILVASLWPRHASVWTISVGLTLAAVALVSSSVWATATVVATSEGPFDSPYQPAQVTYLSQYLPLRARVNWSGLQRYADFFPAEQAADVFETSGFAGYDIMATGHEFLPVGGFTGEVPAPTVAQFKRYVTEEKVYHATVVVKPLTNNPVMRWIILNCAQSKLGIPHFVDNGATYQRYLCTPPDAGGGQLARTSLASVSTSGPPREISRPSP